MTEGCVVRHDMDDLGGILQHPKGFGEVIGWLIGMEIDFDACAPHVVHSLEVRDVVVIEGQPSYDGVREYV